MNFYIVDVFAEDKYQGNQLAVFLLERSFSENDMQKIAKEMNFSETTFILSDKKVNEGYDVRIFTPDTEIPFAGHPTLGTAFVIHKFLNQEKGEKIILNLGVGQIPVTINSQNEYWMTQKSPQFGITMDPKIIADILQIDVENIHKDYPVQVVSTGLPAIIVPLKTLDAVKKCAIKHSEFQKLINDGVKANILVFTPDAEHSENDMHARVFMDDSGFLEDPATGSANGNLAAYLLEHNFLNRFSITLNVEQGYAIGRPSLIKVNADKKDGVFRIGVGGNVFLIAKGEWI
ncbi:MAG TPA: PhzF family phenazine biosynthesis protein [Gammaproteobacteria bacterium]|nr:PhzF family phenazine biosynthesis protein [Gammaproteobacteria bacterium]